MRSSKELAVPELSEYCGMASGRTVLARADMDALPVRGKHGIALCFDTLPLRTTLETTSESRMPAAMTCM